MPNALRHIAFVVAAIFAFVSFPAIGEAQNAVTTGTISGTLLDRDGGTSIAHAAVGLYQGTTKVASTTTAPNGGFAFSNVAPGLYAVLYQALGYGTRRSDDVAVTSGSNTDLRVLLARSATGSSENLREIGRVSAASSLGNGALATSTTITQNVSSEQLQRQAYVRVGDALNTLPGANITGVSSSVGDDLGVDIRGFGNTETQVLIDGHPVGPQGVGGDSFGFQVSPDYAIANTQVTFGSGALGLYGTDAIGGTVDMQTINPTRENHFLVSQGIGYEGRHFSDFQATGSVANHKLGYAFVHANDGTYGPWPTQARLQPGLLSGDYSPANVAAQTYGTSGSYALTTDLFKLRYDFSPKTSFEADEFDSNSFDDKSGNGDNCYNSNSVQLYNAQQAASTASTYTYGSISGNCPAGRVGVTFDQKSLTCITPAQDAALSTGLNGGGPSPFQAHRFHDYHGRIQTSLGINNFTIDGFGSRYSTDYNRNVANSAFDTQFYDTTGLLLSDDIPTQLNDFGFGYFVEHLNHLGTFQTSDVPYLQYGAASIPDQQYSFGIRNFFIRDQYTPPGPLSIFLNTWLKRNTLTQKQTLDPRLSFVLRLSNSDVLRLTGGRSDGQPAPELLIGPASLNQTPSNITATCGGLTSVGNSTNPGLQPESSIDYEIGYGHRFGADTVINADAYYASEKDRIFSGVVPISQIPSVVIPTNLLAAYLARVNAQCGTNNASPADLAFSTRFNASTARYQGLEFNGRYRLDRKLFVDYSYDLQSAVNLGVPNQILQNNFTTINGSQIQGIPLQKYSAGLDFVDLRGFEARVDAYYIGSFNQYNRDPFFYANASLTKQFSRGTSVNIGIQNLFNSQASQLTVKGAAPFQGENQYGTDTSAIQQNATQGINQTGLLPITAVFSVTQRI